MSTGTSEKFVVKIGSTTLEIKHLPREGYHCYMVYATDVCDNHTKRHYLADIIAIKVLDIKTIPTAAEKLKIFLKILNL